MKYLKYFKQVSTYEAFKNGSDYVLPNVSYVEDTTDVKFNPYKEPVVAPIGASIYGLDGKFYSADEWTTAGKNNSDAVGVAVSNGEHSFVIHPTAEQGSTKWSSNNSVKIDGVVTIPTDYRAIAESDFAGEANTAAILAPVQAGTIADAPAAAYAAGITFANGKKGYLPSAGELTLAYTVLSDINSCMTAIGGTKFDMSSKNYWSSTQSSASNAWYWFNYHEYVSSTAKKYTLDVRVVSAL